jgi:PAS domain-containing protein
MLNGSAQRRSHPVDSGSAEIASTLMRILVLDDDREITGQLENALWVWPHKITQTSTVEDTIRLCRHLTPAAILVAVDHCDGSETTSIPALRRRLPIVPIVALVSRKQFVAPGRYLDQGADALLMREDSHRPTLHGLLASVQRNPDALKSRTRAHAPELSIPWCRSEMLGALICDSTGSIVDANKPLAEWLGYPALDDLRGRNVVRNLLANRDDWSKWVQVAGDTNAIHLQDTGITAINGQILWMRLEVFAAPHRPSYLQAVFTDQTELALLTDRSGNTVFPRS